MTNALAKSRTEVATAGYVDPYLAAAAGDGGNATYMKFNGNSGEYTVGQEADEIPEGTKLAVDMVGFRQGWICWKDSAVAEEKMSCVSKGEKLWEEHELTDHGPYVKTAEQQDGWSRQRAVTLRSLADGEEYVFKTSSKSAYRSLGDLLKDFAKQYKSHPGEVPVVQLGTSSFTPKNKQFGKKYVPVLKIVEWAKEADLVAKVSGDDAGDYAETDQAALPPPTETAAPPAETPKAAVEKPVEAAKTETVKPAKAEAAPEKAAEPAKAEATAAATPAAAPADKPVPAQRGARRRQF